MSSLGSTVSGNRYQVGAFWWYASQLLTDESLEIVEFESDSTKVIDDVILRYSRPRPIPNTGLSFQSDYYQIKYHVDHSNALSHAYLIDEKAVSTKKSILERFYGAYQKLQDKGSSRLNLVTNWRWDHTDAFAEVVRRGSFNTKYIKTAEAEAAAKLWMEKLGCDWPAFETFVNRLNLRSSFDLHDQREALNDRLKLAGLAPIDFEIEQSPYDDLGLRLIERGVTKIDRTFLTEFVKKNGIYVREPMRTNSQNILAIRSFKKVFDASTPALEVNLNHLFEEGRSLKPECNWTRDVFGELTAALDLNSLGSLVNPIEAHLDCHLSIAFASGKILSPKKGFQVDLRQRVRGAPVTWASTQATTNPQAQLIAEFEGTHTSSDLVISVAVTRDIHEDVVNSAKGQSVTFDLLKLSSPTIGQTAVANGNDAWMLAESFSNAVSTHLRKYPKRPRVHLYMGVPGGLAFRMGQESAILGSLILYEFDFEGAHKYSPSIQLP